MATNILNITDDETRLAQVIRRVLAGEEVIIGEAGKPLVKIIRYDQNDEPRRPGAWEGKIRIADDFDELSENLATAIEGDTESTTAP